MREGRLSSEQRLTSPPEWKGLPNKSSESSERRRNDGGKTINLLLLAERNFSDAIFPNVLGSTWSWLQSNFNCTRPLNWGNLWGRFFIWFRDKSRTLRLPPRGPSQRVSGYSSSWLPHSRNSVRGVLAMASGSVLITLLDRSRRTRCFN